MKKASRKLLGRPSEFSQKVADQICEEIAKGRSVRAICADKSAEFDGLPSERSIYRWLEDEANVAFRQQYARAREAQADGKFEETWEIAKAATAETVQVARLQIDTLKWQTGKLAPKKYGEKVAHVGGGEGDAPIQTASEVTVRFIRPGDVPEAS
jgi:hypothetical protein